MAVCGLKVHKMKTKSLRAFALILSFEEPNAYDVGVSCVQNVPPDLTRTLASRSVVIIQEKKTCVLS